MTNRCWTTWNEDTIPARGHVPRKTYLRGFPVQVVRRVSGVAFYCACFATASCARWMLLDLPEMCTMGERKCGLFPWDPLDKHLAFYCRRTCSYGCRLCAVFRWFFAVCVLCYLVNDFGCEILRLDVREGLMFIFFGIYTKFRINKYVRCCEHTKFFFVCSIE